MEIIDRDIEDVVRALGYLCLGSRFKRLGEQLQAGTQQILAELGSNVPVGQFPLLAALDRLGPLSVGEMALAMGISQPGITRSLLQLAELGVIDMTASADDRRRRVATLTEAGRDLVQRSQAGVWGKVEAAVADLCDGLEGSLLEQLAGMEDGLAARPLQQRGAMPHPLDHPVWSALTGPHSGLAIGPGGALRYPADISPFAAMRDDSPESLAALAALVRPGETVVLVGSTPIVLPPELEAVTMATAVQMVAFGGMPEPADARPELLGPADHAAMYELALLTRPGPFARRSMTLGTFWGIREQGRLVAMAGERLRQDDWTELSGVCVHPDQRGKGFGRLLSSHVVGHIRAKGERPYLHVFASNIPAIALYRSLGFEQRETMNVVTARRRP